MKFLISQPLKEIYLFHSNFVTLQPRYDKDSALMHVKKEVHF